MCRVSVGKTNSALVRVLGTAEIRHFTLDVSVAEGYLLGVASGTRLGFAAEPCNYCMQEPVAARGFVACNQDACSGPAAACRRDLVEVEGVAG